MTETIYALSSGAPPAAIAIMRLSGPRAFATAAALSRRTLQDRVPTLCVLTDPADGTILDQALLLGFAAPRSATGEDVVELHLHGGRAVVRAVEEVLACMPGLRAAEPGEFTRRALINGRIDLTEAEGLADLLMAETEAQRRAALIGAEGGMRRLVEAWTAEAVAIAAQVEAMIDFEDEGDVGTSDLLLARAHVGAATLADKVERTLAAPPAERLRDGIRVVIAGPPNVGKSTLLNALAGRDAAITSSIAGTTRDIIEVPVVHDGIAWLLTDSAGLHDRTDDPVERIGIDRARKAIAAADLILWLSDAPTTDTRAVLIHPRADVAGRDVTPADRIAVSARSGIGLAEVWGELHRRAQPLLPAPDQLSLNIRQYGLLSSAAAALRRTADVSDPLIVAAELQDVLATFEQLTGRATTEHVLDDLFGRFCIGK